MHKIVHFFSHLVADKELSHHGHQLYEEQFINFLSRHGKSYGTHEEFKYRLSIFQDNMKKINTLASINDDEMHDVRPNFMADWSEEDYKQLLGYKKELKKPSSTVFTAQDDSSVPDSVDWNKAGAVTPIKNQGMCGSCWAFSATGSMEGRYQVKNKDLVSLSEQQLVDCSKTKDGNQGCNGGLMDLAFTYAEKTNLELESEYPYTGTDGSCHAEGGKYHVSDFTDVATKDPAALQAAVAEGPVSVAIDASGLAFQFYFGGIISMFCGTTLDHGVLVVGYGTENGKDYWLLKNSWGASWGEKGFFRIKRDMSKKDSGICGLQEQPSFPIM